MATVAPLYKVGSNNYKSWPKLKVFRCVNKFFRIQKHKTQSKRDTPHHSSSIKSNFNQAKKNHLIFMPIKRHMKHSNARHNIQSK